MTNLRLSLYIALFCASLFAVDRCQTQPKPITADFTAGSLPHYLPTYPDAHSQHSNQSGQDGTDGPNSLLDPNLQPQPPDIKPKPQLFPFPFPPLLPLPPTAPVIDPAEMVYTATLLYYFCGDNVAILDVYVDRLGHAKMRTFTRWNYPNPAWYNNQLRELEKRDQSKPVYFVELDNRCTKS